MGSEKVERTGKGTAKAAVEGQEKGQAGQSHSEERPVGPDQDPWKLFN